MVNQERKKIMNINTADRSTLKSYFVEKAIPTEDNFADLIDGMINPKDDGLVKSSGNPLAIGAGASSEKPVLQLYDNLNAQTPDWTVALKANAVSTKRGLSVLNAEQDSVLFIDRETGNVGINTVNTTNTLTVLGDASISNTLKSSNTIIGSPKVSNIKSTKLFVYGHIASAQIYFSAFLAPNTKTDQQIVKLQSVSQNVGGGYDGVSNFKAPVNGVYLFTMTGYKVSSKGRGEAQWILMKNKNNQSTGVHSSEGTEDSSSSIVWASNENSMASRTFIVSLKRNEEVFVVQTGRAEYRPYFSGLEGVLISATLPE